MDALQKFHTAVDPEVMQKVPDEHDIVIVAQLRLESISREGREETATRNHHIARPSPGARGWTARMAQSHNCAVISGTRLGDRVSRVSSCGVSRSAAMFAVGWIRSFNI